MFFFFLFTIMISTTMSLQTKTCTNCKFFTITNKCLLFPKIDETEKSNHKLLFNEFIANRHQKKMKKIKEIKEKIKEKIDYFYCSTAREFNDMCGKNATNHTIIYTVD